MQRQRYENRMLGMADVLAPPLMAAIIY